MWQDKLKEIIHILENSNVNEIEIKSWGHQYRVVKNPGVITNSISNVEQPTVLGESKSNPKVELNKVDNTAESEPAQEEIAVEEVLSPMPGTFYAAPTPEDSNYVQVGDNVTKGQTLCIIEAMKIMNEIESDHDGVIAEIKIEDGNPVEYNQVLFTIKPA
tara:strand:- start:93 stop:572 length:480 start_codon:yes stop_codon:yes gene_type:complete